MNATLQLWRRTIQHGPASFLGRFPAPDQLPHPDAGPQALKHTRFQHTTEFRGHVRHDPSPAPRRPPAPGRPPGSARPAPGPASARRGQRGAGRTLPGGRGGAGPHFRGFGRVSAGWGLREASGARAGLWPPAAGGGQPQRRGRLLEDLGWGREKENIVGLGDIGNAGYVLTGRRRQVWFKGKGRAVKQYFKIYIILVRFVSLLLCHSKEILVRLLVPCRCQTW